MTDSSVAQSFKKGTGHVEYKRRISQRSILIAAILTVNVFFISYLFSHKYHNFVSVEPALTDKFGETLVRMSKSIVKCYQHPNNLLNDRNATSCNDSVSDINMQTTLYPVVSNFERRTPRAKDLVIGMALGIDPISLAIFCYSLNKTAPTAGVVLFVNKEIISTFPLENLPNIVFIEVSRSLLSESFKKFHPSSSRWLIFHQYLMKRNRYKRFERIWMLDVRDTVFQSNPFAVFDNEAESFHVFQEDGEMLIEQCGWNSKWISDCFHHTIFRYVSNKYIICSGVSAGTTALVMKYLNITVSLFSGMNVQNIYQHFLPACERNGVDQGIHNVIIHKNLIPSIKVHTEKDKDAAYVVNMQASQSFQIVDGHQIVNHRLEPFAVVHQYDRNYELHRALGKIYVPSLNLEDPLSEWQTTLACTSTYKLIVERDAFFGKCDMKITSSLTVAGCCEHCSSAKEPNRQCQAFAFVGGKCFLKSCGSASDYSQGLKVYFDNPDNYKLPNGFTGYS